MGCSMLFGILEDWFSDLIVKREESNVTIAFPIDKLVRSSVHNFIKNLSVYLALDDGREFSITYYEGDNGSGLDLSVRRDEDSIFESFVCVGGVKVSLGRVRGTSSVLVEVSE